MDPNLVITQITAGAACAYTLQLLQKWEKLTWVTQHTVAINHAFRIVMSGIAVLGIHQAWTPSESGGGVLAITIPPMTVIVHGLWQWFGQFALQHGWGKLLAVGDRPPMSNV